MDRKMKKRLSWLLSFSLLSTSAGIWSNGGMQAGAEGEETVVKMLQNGNASGLDITYPTPATSFQPSDILYLVGVDSTSGQDAVTQGDLSGNAFRMTEKKSIVKWKAVVQTSSQFEVTDWGDTTLTVKAGDKLAHAISVKGFREKSYDVISAILVPKNGGDITAYGSVAAIDPNSAEDSMEVGITMPQDVSEGKYMLHLYAEQSNGYYATNSQSGEIEVTGDTEAPAASAGSAEPSVSPEPAATATVTPSPAITTVPVPPVTTVPTLPPAPTSVVTPEPTKQPVQTVTPVPSNTPAVTPVSTKRPVQTATPAPTGTPVVTVTPTKQPVQTLTPVPSNTPAVPTERPIHTLTPVPSNTPAAMTAPPRPVQTQRPPVPSKDPGEVTEPAETMMPVQEENQAPEPGSTVKQENVTYKVTESGGVTLDKVKASQSKRKMAIPDTVVVHGQEYKVDTISAGAFAGNKKVEQVILGKNVKKIEKKAFSGCTNLKQITLSNKVTTVGAESFSGCTSLKKVTLPDSVKKIGAKAFQGCKSLKNVKIGKKAPKVKGGAVSAAPYIRVTKNGVLAVETVPVYSADSPALTIGNYAFAACSSMKKVIINSAVRVIGSSAFRGCKKLSDIIVNSQILQKVRKMALKGINNCTITVPTNKFRPYRTLFRNKGQGKKVLIAKV